MLNDIYVYMLLVVLFELFLSMNIACSVADQNYVQAIIGTFSVII